MHRLLIFDLHQHGFAGADIGDRIGEDVRPLLLGQRGLAPGRAGLLIDHPRLLPFLDVADNDPIADHHLERVDRAARRQRINIGRLDPVLRRVTEDLRDAGADGRAGHREVDIDAEPGCIGVAVVGLQQQRPGPCIGGSYEIGLRILGRPHRLEAYKQGGKSHQDHGSALHQQKQDQLHAFAAEPIGSPVQSRRR